MATKNEALEKSGLNSADLDGFSGETLDQMALENLEGGTLPPVDLNIGKCTDYSGNCVSGCAC